MRASKKNEAAKQPARKPTAKQLADAKARALVQSVADAEVEMKRQAEHVAILESRVLTAEKQLSAMTEALERCGAKITAQRVQIEALERAVGVKPPAQTIAVPTVIDDDDILPGAGRR